MDIEDCGHLCRGKVDRLGERARDERGLVSVLGRDNVPGFCYSEPKCGGEDGRGGHV